MKPPRSLMFWVILIDVGLPGTLRPTEPADVGSLPEVISMVLAEPPSYSRLKSLRKPMLEWAATDPQAALAWVQGSSKGFEQQQLTNAILGTWTLHEPIAAATYALGLPLEKRGSWESLRQVVMFWSRNEPRATLAWVQKLTPGSEQNDLINLTVGGWTPREPEAAAAFALGFPPGRERIMLVNTVLKEWLRVDPAPAWEFAKSLPADASRPDTLHELLADWGSRDPTAALSHVTELPDPAEHQSMQNRLVWRLAEKDSAAALDYARKLSGVDRDSALYEVANFLADRDPKAAAVIAGEISPGESQKYVGEMLASGQGKIAIGVAETDPAEAIALISEIPRGRQRNNAILFVALTVAEHDPRAAMALAEANPEADESEGVRFNVLPVWAMNDFAGAVAWVRKLPVGVSRDQIASRLADQWAERNPHEAFVFMQTLADSGSRNDFQRRLADHWVSTDPTAARDAAASLPAGKMRDEFIGCLLRPLAKQSPRDMADLVTLMSNGWDQYKAIEGVIYLWSESDSSAAAKWVASLPAGPVLEIAVRSMFKILIHADRAAAEAWLKQQDISPELMQELLGKRKE